MANAITTGLGDEADAVIATSAADALDLLRYRGPFDLVLSDANLPGAITGRDFFLRARAIDPGLVRRFAFLVGALSDEQHARIRATGARCLHQPVSLAGVRALLGWRAPD